MKKRAFSLVLAVFVLSAVLAGCSSEGVPQSEYDELLEKYNAAVAERDELSEDVKELQESAGSSDDSVSVDLVRKYVNEADVDGMSVKAIEEYKTLVFIVSNNLEAGNAMLAFSADKSLREDFEDLAVSLCENAMDTFPGWNAVCLMQSNDGAYIAVAVNGVAIEPTVQKSQSSTSSSSKPSGSSTSSSSSASSGMTTGQKNALASAKSYLKYLAFSYTGLIEQLEYEKYSHEDAVFAADNCGADWFEQAALCAASYLKYSSFSKQGLIDQLVYEGFTLEQATYGVEQNGY